MELRSNRAVLDGIHAIKEASYFVDPTQAGHIMRVLREMYENPVRAAIREYGANAQDAHRQAGIPDRPFEVWAPNAMTPVLRIRDFGPGLPHESADKQDVVHLLLGFGSSGEHKRTGPTANSQIGGFGIGCKSAFAVTDSFTYHVYHNKRHRTYLCYLDEHDKGCSKMVFDKAAPDEPSGIEVEIPVAREQLALFNNELATAFSFFTPPPVIHGGKVSVIETKPLLESTPECNITVPGTKLSMPWKIYSGTVQLPGCANSNVVVIMGGIAYPVRLQTLFQNVSARDTSPAPNIMLAKFSTMIMAPIGAFDLAPSRETLQYSKHTIQLLEHALSNLVTKQVPARVQPQIDAQPDPYAAFDAWDRLLTESLATLHSFPASLSEIKDYCQKGGASANNLSLRRRPDSITMPCGLDFTSGFVFKDKPKLVPDFSFVPQSFLDAHQLQIHALRASRGSRGRKAGARFVPIHGRWDSFLSELRTAEEAINATPKVRSAIVATHPWPKTMWPRNAGSSESVQRSDGTSFQTQLSVDWSAARYVYYMQHKDLGPGYYFRVFAPSVSGIRRDSIHIFLGTTPDPRNAHAYIRHYMFQRPMAPARYSAEDAVWITGPASGIKAFRDTYSWLLSEQEVTVMQDVTWVPEKRTTVAAATTTTSATPGLPSRKSSAGNPCITGWHTCTNELAPVSRARAKQLTGVQYFTVGYRKEVTSMADVSYQREPGNIRSLWQMVMSTPGKKDSPELFYLRQGHESSIRSRFPNITWTPAKDAMRDKLLAFFHGPQSCSPTGGFTAATYVALTQPLICGRSPGSFSRSIDRVLNPSHPNFVRSDLNADVLTAVRAAITHIMNPSWTQHTWPAGSPVPGLLHAIETAFPSALRDWYPAFTDALHSGVSSGFWERNLDPVLGDLFLADYDHTTVSPAIRKQVVTLVKPIITTAASLLNVIKILPAADRDPQALGIIQSWCAKHTLW